jgi:hypothetical protein
MKVVDDYQSAGAVISAIYLINKIVISFSMAKYGIYLTHPNSFKRCYNCANYNDKECTAIKRVEVSENHSCKRFYSYRTYLGGGFSPR